MTTTELLLTILVIALATMLTRFLVFFLFPAGRETPPFMKYLGNVLPPAVLGMLVVYCYRSIDFTSSSHGIPEVLAGLAVILCQKWKKNMFLSIVVGTALYMLLLRVL